MLAGSDSVGSVTRRLRCYVDWRFAMVLFAFKESSVTIAAVCVFDFILNDVFDNSR